MATASTTGSTGTTRVREVDDAGRMSEHEALMWNIEKDPWLNPSGASLIVFDRPLDMDHFRRQIRAGVARTPRLYQRAVPGFGRISTPAWVPDAEFDLDAHIRELVLPEPGDDRTLLDLAARLYAEPLDRTRPLWRFVVISGLSGGRGAVWSIIHHSISDGIGQMRIAEMYQQLERDAPPADEVDLEAIVAEAAAAHRAKESGGNTAQSMVSTLRDSSAHLLRRQVGIGRRLLGEVAMWPADPRRVGDSVGNVVDTVKGVLDQVGGDGEDRPAGSPLWAERSRHRELEWVRADLSSVKATGAAFGATINDVFMAAVVEAVYRYHAERGVGLETTNTSFVLSTRRDGKAGGNSFTPVPITLPAGPMSAGARIGSVVAEIEAAKERASRTGGLTGLSGVANLLPISAVTQAARAAARRIDVATSNLRGAAIPLYCAGAEVQATIPMGPVAGTGANITAMSYNGGLDIGIFCDPAAITEPAAFARHLDDAFTHLADAAESHATKKQSAAKKKTATKKKTAAKKTATKKRAATKKKTAAKTKTAKTRTAS